MHTLNNKRKKVPEEQSENQTVPTELIDYAKSMFDRYAADFDHLDNKAIAVIGVVGLLVSFQALSFENLVYIFNAAAVGEIPRLECLTIIGLVVHVSFLVFSIYRALAAFQVRSLEYPADVMELAEKFRKEKLTNRLSVDIVKTYAKSIDSLDQVRAIKAKHLRQSLFGIFIAVISLIVYLALLLIHKSFS